MVAQDNEYMLSNVIENWFITYVSDKTKWHNFSVLFFHMVKKPMDKRLFGRGRQATGADRCCSITQSILFFFFHSILNRKGGKIIEEH